MIDMLDRKGPREDWRALYVRAENRADYLLGLLNQAEAEIERLRDILSAATETCIEERDRANRAEAALAKLGEMNARRP